MVVDTTVLVHDIRYFVVAYAIAIATALLPPDMGYVRIGVAVLLVAIYARYVKGHFDAEAEDEADELPPLRFHRLDPSGVRSDPVTPRLRIVGFQVVLALACIIGGAYLFVGAVNRIAEAVGISELLLALVIAPIATELPEKFNSLIWVRQGKDTLAMGNITGAMVFQSAIPVVVALVLAGERWHIDEDSLIAFLSAGDGVRRRRGDLRPDVAAGPARRPVAARGWRRVPRLPGHRGPRDPGVAPAGLNPG